LQVVATGIENPDFGLPQVIWRMLRFFTILTSLLVGLGCARMVWRGRFDGPVWLGGLTLWSAITGVVYHALFARDLAGVAWWADLGLHTLVPVAVFAMWLLRMPKDGLGLRATLLWLLWPLIYVGYALVRGSFEGVYPYFFVNPDQIGWLGVLRWSGVLCGAFFVAGLGLVGVPRLRR